ncbi:MAG: hypothetical protein OEW68_07830 [Gammaproteobacteria bacterium]|nr:hypothetical protein [Gammaproteobacteria bacterium]MDH4314734.1 hypothetical protein [Gammaproteobacteria bacterium]MDH5215910.1 hypothetical protein [Gammaproteobacteria bacterium]MDH5501119.1 hypothetical protein [Gammaproteobacteria bacterium]
MKSPPLLLFLLSSLPAISFGQEDLWSDDDWGEEDQASRWSGFIEAGLGTRFGNDPLIAGRSTLEEIRWRLESEWRPGHYAIGFKGDAAYDRVENRWTGDLRDLTIAFTAGKSTDVNLGRQVQTWGTGDLVFLNDLFPKDFVSFFAGRDDEYLKAAGNAVRVTLYAPAVNVDFSWTPVFEPDNYLTGERFSFFSPLAGGNVAPSPPLSAIEPSKSLSNGEFALRLFRTVESREYAIYAYRGFFKQPNALTETLQATFAPMNSLGASLRQPAGPGLLNAEISYYDSRDDRNGSDPRIPNDQFRFLTGYEWEAKANFTVGLQYFLEWTLDHDALIDNSPYPQYEADEFRHLLTNRLTWRTGRDKFTWSLFSFFSPSDHDFYLRPVFAYRRDDQWSVTAGANLFDGKDEHTFFGQLQDASNAYIRIRYHY